MQTLDAFLIVDQQACYHRAVETGRPLDNALLADVPALLINVLGRSARRLALVAAQDVAGQAAFRQAGYEVLLANGDRPYQIDRLSQALRESLAGATPCCIALVGADPGFMPLCRQASRMPGVELHVWFPAAETPLEFRQPEFHYRPLEELLAPARKALVDVRLDFENIYIGLVKRGWDGNVGKLAQALREAFADAGRVARITAYADFDVLEKRYGSHLHGDLLRAEVDVRYLISQKGKNSADMVMADDMRTVIDRDQAVIGLVTCDFDFRATLKAAQARGRRLILLTLRADASRALLQQAGSDVRFLDDYLSLAPAAVPVLDPADVKAAAGPSGSWQAAAGGREAALAVVKAAAWLQAQSFRFAPRHALEPIVGAVPLAAALRAGLLVEGAHVLADGSLVATVSLACDVPFAAAARYLVGWVRSRLTYSLRVKGMPYVDTNYLVRGMQLDQKCRDLGIGLTQADAEGWLELLADAGAFVRTSRPRFGRPNERVDAWLLAGNVTDDDSRGSDLATSSPRAIPRIAQPATTGVPRLPVRPSLAIAA